eukprot:TRINITY_DN936_c0_g1_i7.p1 TRINITY_DN936_c0_g1~~TRINITY_DN936_c0_g1_i7.p1  ORF type:complete len:337 (+),score=79.26 TRINITY_DN936_c0_g1_i7:125-1012(+)
MGGARVMAQRRLEKDMHKHNLQKVMELLKDDPARTMRCLLNLQEGLFSKELDDVGTLESERWPKPYMWFKQVGKYWLGGWLVKNIDGMIEELVDAIDEKDPLGIRNLVDFACGTMANQKLPRECLSKQTLNLTLTRMFKERASIGPGWAQKLITRDGVIDWQNGGAFRPHGEFDENGNVSTVLYAPTLAVKDIPKGWNLSTSWAWKNNWHDHLATAENDISKVAFAAKLFADSKLHEKFSAEAFEAMAKKITEEEAAKDAILRADPFTATLSLITPKKRKCAATEKSSTLPAVVV